MLYGIYLVSFVNKKTGSTKTQPVTALNMGEALDQAWKDARIKEDHRHYWQPNVAQVSSFRFRL